MMSSIFAGSDRFFLIFVSFDQAKEKEALSYSISYTPKKLKSLPLRYFLQIEP
jgi:hypothetical protein